MSKNQHTFTLHKNKVVKLYFVTFGRAFSLSHSLRVAYASCKIVHKGTALHKMPFFSVLNKLCRGVQKLYGTKCSVNEKNKSVFLCLRTKVQLFSYF